jgi:dephospho-CoA kinase
MARTSRAASFTSELPGFAVGLTGGIGSGKTAVADLFAALGAAIIDSDVIAQSLTAAHGAAIGAIRREFGDEFIRADGALDRPKMRERVFRDRLAKARLEAILHPRIREQASEQARAALGHAPFFIFVVPLLIETRTAGNGMERLLVVDCSPATQVRRVCARSRLDAALVRSIIAQQASRSERLDAADDVLVNEGPLEMLGPRVQRLHSRYCELARERASGV